LVLRQRAQRAGDYGDGLRDYGITRITVEDYGEDYGDEDYGITVTITVTLYSIPQSVQGRTITVTLYSIPQSVQGR